MGSAVHGSQNKLAGVPEWLRDLGGGQMEPSGTTSLLPMVRSVFRGVGPP